MNAIVVTQDHVARWLESLRYLTSVLLPEKIQKIDTLNDSLRDQIIMRIWLLNLINNIYKEYFISSTYKTPSILGFMKGHFKLVKDSNIEPVILPKVITPTDWGPHWWEFLHMTSILVHKKETLATEFALFMLNFGLLLPCSICQINYKAKNAYKNVYLPIISNFDTITPIFNLHNLVNINKEFPSKQLTEADFKQIYKV